MLNEFVEKILVHEAEGTRQGYGRFQKVDIYLNFIGKLNINIPGQEKPELKPFDPVEHQREIWRNYYHRHKEEIRAKQAQSYEEKRQAKLASMPVKSPEEIKAEVEARHEKRKEYQRKYQREWNDRRRQARLAVLAAKPALTPEEIEAKAKARHERHKAYEREYKREWRLRRKQVAGEADQASAV
jgi:hypothetical protein